MEEKFIPLISEVADIIQIGSRNMQNYPFLTAIAKTGKPIMLKRHYGASLRDWLGAAEYILAEGNKNVITYESTKESQNAVCNKIKGEKNIYKEQLDMINNCF